MKYNRIGAYLTLCAGLLAGQLLSIHASVWAKEAAGTAPDQFVPLDQKTADLALEDLKARLKNPNLTPADLTGNSALVHGVTIDPVDSQSVGPEMVRPPRPKPMPIRPIGPEKWIPPDLLKRLRHPIKPRPPRQPVCPAWGCGPAPIRIIGVGPRPPISKRPNCPIPECAAPMYGCRWSGGTNAQGCPTCGQMVCTEPPMSPFEAAPLKPALITP